ncbi:uncharacterized protein LOC117470659 [Trematomus bernacchii]|uniref:uncharacterized protein LOC117470659 n=1 Tax=Trematomus bernacchii TaxID=40690 RepID=UPI00146B46FC|nr:uncharacterized protein LOC117470659 [Trematomus bernacchii]
MWIQRRRVRDSMRRIDPEAAALRAMSQRLHRRAYRVAGPNSLWHLDGNHKLIRWRIVIHGGIDGYSRLVVFLRASDNNRSSTVMASFMDAVAKYGVPSRVRTDHGGENNSVCLMMNIFRGSHRGSALRGRSTHNQRIERLWGDLWRGVSNVYYDLFNFLESEGIIDIDNEMHMWALHYVYLPRINHDLRVFLDQWNNHGLRTERHQSPIQLFVQGCLERQGQTTSAMQSLFGGGQGDAQEEPEREGGADAGDVAQEEPEREGGADAGDVALDWPERVTVPRNQHLLSDEDMEQLTAQFDPLAGRRGDLGLDIIRNILSFMATLNVV